MAAERTPQPSEEKMSDQAFLRYSEKVLKFGLGTPVVRVKEEVFSSPENLRTYEDSAIEPYYQGGTETAVLHTTSFVNLSSHMEDQGMLEPEEELSPLAILSGKSHIVLINTEGSRSLGYFILPDQTTIEIDPPYYFSLQDETDALKRSLPKDKPRGLKGILVRFRK